MDHFAGPIVVYNGRVRARRLWTPISLLGSCKPAGLPWVRDGDGRPAQQDAVMYIMGALKKFDALTSGQMREIGYEIAVLGRRGLDTNDSTLKYTLRSLPGEFSGMDLVSIMCAACQQVVPEKDVGIDLSSEHKMIA